MAETLQALRQRYGDSDSGNENNNNDITIDTDNSSQIYYC